MSTEIITDPAYKHCTKCKEPKPLSDFYNYSNSSTGKSYKCKSCLSKENVERKRTKRGLAINIFYNQTGKSRRSNRPFPSYTKKDLYDWMLSQPHFERLYNDWDDSGFEKDLRPSVDRTDSLEPYTMSNIQLMSWAENNEKGKREKYKRAVKQFTKDGALVGEYESAAMAMRITGIQSRTISSVCRHYLNHKSAGGYLWEYAA